MDIADMIFEDDNLANDEDEDFVGEEPDEDPLFIEDKDEDEAEDA